MTAGPAIAAAGPVAAPLRPGRAWTAAYDIRLALPLGAFFLVFFLAPRLPRRDAGRVVQRVACHVGGP